MIDLQCTYCVLTLYGKDASGTPIFAITTTAEKWINRANLRRDKIRILLRVILQQLQPIFDPAVVTSFHTSTSQAGPQPLRRLLLLL